MTVHPAKTQMPSLIRVFTVCMKKTWVLSYPLSAQRRLWSDWVDAQADLSLHWAHISFCWFCYDAAHMWFVLLHNLCFSRKIVKRYPLTTFTPANFQTQTPHNMRHVMRKPVNAIILCNNKGADQHEHPRSLISTFVVRCLDSMISLMLAISWL